MKHKRERSWRKIFAVFGLIVCGIWFVWAVEVLPADFKPPAKWGEAIDSAKWFITLADGTMWDSTAGAARTDCARYDSTITGLSNDTGYLVVLRMWDGSDSASEWTFYWPIISSAPATVSDANMGAIADSVWDKAYADMVAQAGGAGDSLWAILNDLLDSLQNHDDWVATATELTKAIDSINAVLDTLQLYDGRYALAAELTKTIDSVNAILDTLQLYDGRYALAAELTKAIDSINGILDTLQLHDDWVATEVTAAKALDSLADILDSLENYDDWIAAAANLTKAIDSINALLDTLQVWDTRIDSIEAALDDASIGDKVWTDAVTRAITAGVLTTSEWEKVWHDIDTTNIDTSEIGEWFSTGVAASISDANMAKIADSVDAELTANHGAGPWTTGTGSGDNDVRIYAIDTSGTDDSIMGVNITIKTIAGVFDAAQTTNSNGYRDFTLPTDSMKYLGSKVGYQWITDTINVTADDTVAIYGYNVPLQESPDPNLCRVQGYISLPGGLPTKKIKVTFSTTGGVYNFCDSTAFIPEPVSILTSTHDDSLGLFAVNLIPSGCLLTANGDSLQYTINATCGTYKMKEKLIWVPQEASFAVVW